MNRIRRNDQVLVTTGKDRGKRGTVRSVYPKEQRAVVQGVNIARKHMKARDPQHAGGIIDIELPIHWSNLMVICRSCSRPTRTGFRARDDGTKVRVCKRCGEDIE